MYTLLTFSFLEFKAVLIFQAFSFSVYILVLLKVLVFLIFHSEFDIIFWQKEVLFNLVKAAAITLITI